MCHLFIYSDDRELVSLAESCWLKVMTERQRTLEENYKMEISASHTADKGPVRMRDVSPLWEEMASKTWLLYSGQPSVAAHRTMKEMEHKKNSTIFFCCVFSESQKKRAASGSQSKLDLISSVVRSALGRHGKQSGTVEVTTLPLLC